MAMDTNNTGDYSSDEEGAEMDLEAEEVLVDFEAYSIIEEDFDGIKQLLIQLFSESSSLPFDDIARCVIKQQGIGGILKEALPSAAQEDTTEPEGVDEEDADDKEVYGLFSILPISLPELNPLLQFLSVKLQSHADPDNIGRLTKLICQSNSDSKGANSRSVAILLNERLINLPYKVALPCLESLLDDLKSCSQDAYKLSALEHFVVICQIYKEVGSTKKRKNSKRLKAEDSSAASSDGIVYFYPEEELLFKDCEAWFDYPVVSSHANASSADITNCFRRVLIISKATLLRYVDRLKNGEML